jgi:hypothetical protein
VASARRPSLSPGDGTNLGAEGGEQQPPALPDATREAGAAQISRRSSWLPVDYGESESAMGIARKVRAPTLALSAQTNNERNKRYTGSQARLLMTTRRRLFQMEDTELGRLRNGLAIGVYQYRPSWAVDSLTTIPSVLY